MLCGHAFWGNNEYGGGIEEDACEKLKWMAIPGHDDKEESIYDSLPRDEFDGKLFKRRKVIVCRE
jgi:hypothetical protein